MKLSLIKKYIQILIRITLLFLISTNLFSNEHFSSLLAKAYFDHKDIAIIQLTYDGVNTVHTGVGAVVSNTALALSKLNTEEEKQFKLYFISNKYAEGLPEYSLLQLEKNKQLCQDTGGDVFLIPTSKNDVMFGLPSDWEELCEKSADLCVSLINQHQHTIILAHDTVYAQVPLKIFERSAEIKNSYQSIWIPHATSWNYNGHNSSLEPLWPERHHWELESLQKAKKCDYHVGYIHPSMKNCLLNEPFFGDPSVFMLYSTGILLDKYLTTYSEDEIKQELLKRNIPLNKKLIFSIGRATSLKGHDISLEVYRHLKQIHPEIHLVLLAPVSDHMPEYQEILKQRIVNENLDVTLIDSFDSNLDAYIYQWKNTAIISLLSRVDTQPLTMMEARANPSKCILLASNSSFSGSNVLDGINGYTCSLEGLESIITSPIKNSSAIDKIVQIADEILNLPEEKQKSIIDAGKNLIATQFDLKKNMKKNIESLLESYVSSLSLDFKLAPNGIGLPPHFLRFGDDKPLGVLKKIQASDYDLMNSRLKLLKSIQNQNPTLFPKIFQNQDKELITQFENDYCYLIEYLQEDQSPITMEEMLEATGKLHQLTCDISVPKILEQSKLQEFYQRKLYFQDPWFSQYDEQIFKGKEWDNVVNIANFFSSDSFLKIYEQLPKQLIHGDNNQTNIIKSHGQIYFIDLDSFRYDVRLLDLASYFRYGGFSKYFELLKVKKLDKILYQYYSSHTKEFLPIEKEAFESIVLFSHIEFISWAMKKLKQAAALNSPLKTLLSGLVIEYKDKIWKLTNEL